MSHRLAIRSLAALVIGVGLFGTSASYAADGDVVASGTFTGASGHTASGSVTVQKSGDSYTVVLGPDFQFDGAPDPKLGFGKNGYDSSSKFSHLNANSGQQEYDLPSSVQPGGYNEVWIWCEKYAVPLGVAELQ